jgi:hypothetical protein
MMDLDKEIDALRKIKIRRTEAVHKIKDKLDKLHKNHHLYRMGAEERVGSSSRHIAWLHLAGFTVVAFFPKSGFTNSMGIWTVDNDGTNHLLFGKGHVPGRDIEVWDLTYPWEKDDRDELFLKELSLWAEDNEIKRAKEEISRLKQELGFESNEAEVN